MKIQGITLITFSCLLLCGAFCREKKRRESELRSAVELAEMIRGELETRLASIPELTARLKKSSAGTTLEFLKRLESSMPELGEKTFPQLWSETVLSTYTHLRRDELEDLCRLGNVLGRYSLDNQVEALMKCAHRFSEAEKQYAQRMPENRRLGVSIVCTCCILLIIVLT